MKNNRLYISITAAAWIVFAMSGCGGDTPGNGGGNGGGKIEVMPGMTVVGFVTDQNGEPIQEAVVSDGFNVVQTDGKGIYQMASTDEARFVFVSVPADCEIPVSDGMPAIYQKIGTLPAGKAVQRDFRLTRSAKKEKFSLIAMADVQIANSTDLTYLTVDIPKIHAHIQQLDTPVYGISLGDLVWDNMSYFTEYAGQIKRLEIPVFQVIGNHDHNTGVIDNDTASAAGFEKAFGPTYYSVNIGDCHIVALDDVYYRGGKTYDAYITPEQLEWLEKDLSYVDRDKLIVLGLHISTKRRNSVGQVSNNADLYKILEGYKVRILSGHHHNNYTTTITADIEENTLGAVCGAFWSGDLCNDGSPKGFAVYEFEGNEIKNRYYKGTNHGKDYQMYLYKPGESVSGAYRNAVLVNVFNWHTDWTVSLSVDGGFVTTLTDNIVETDRRAYDYMQGDTKPAYRPTVANPETKNDHMLFFRPQGAWSTITIKATDSHGNVFTGSLTNG